jgi:hypothetical protein
VLERVFTNFPHAKLYERKKTFSLSLVTFSLTSDAESAVDGVDIRHSSHELAVKTIKNASDKMTMLVQSLNTAGVIRFPSSLRCLCFALSLRSAIFAAQPEKSST